jgi:hypothetical protein
MGKCIVAAASVFVLAAAGSAWAAGPSNAARAVVVKVGRSHVLAAGTLRPGETVRCVDHGRVLSVEAPASPAVSNGTVWTQAGATRFHLHVTAKKGGGYVVDCGPGGFHWVQAVPGNKAPRRPSDSFLAL